jgi:lipoate-protein ligase A
VTTWHAESVVGSASELHGRDLPAERTVWTFQPTEPAVVLGSTQPASVVRPGAGIEVVHRRSGGGAVLLVPGEVLWVDVIVPRHDVLWDDDVGRATHWLGELWVRALTRCGVVGATVHTGTMVCRPWSKLVCFAGLGPGEVTVGEGKAVGISQRRTRVGARFQCALYHRWDPAALVAVLADPRPGVDELAGSVAEIDVPLGDVQAALLAELTLV